MSLESGLESYVRRPQTRRSRANREAWNLAKIAVFHVEADQYTGPEDTSLTTKSLISRFGNQALLYRTIETG
ncbi:hypothetical protein [Paenibacillus sp. EZ-K15]|uniref:hypothetical protein n=1 Tax=Paenibacillus sp. EZ-K15 TaxID=2044275 RepID=UPI000BF6806A|nr:hypothetical protein [Paenibacillus sp. EZ-K15]